MPTYKVQPGDCLTKIAADHGFADYKVIYDHPQNAAFKAKRPNPHVILAGDEVFIPQVREKTEVFSSGEIHRIIVKRPPAEIRLFVKDADGEPFAGRSYVLRAHGAGERRGKTDDAGLVQERVPAMAVDATLEFPSDGLEFHLKLGQLDPLAEATGLLGRLENLGFSSPGEGDSESEEAIRHALARFQATHGLEPTGELDGPTANRLRDSHDGGEES